EMSKKGRAVLMLESLRGDPVLSLYINGMGCCCGTAFGHVSAYFFEYEGGGANENEDPYVPKSETIGLPSEARVNDLDVSDNSSAARPLARRQPFKFLRGAGREQVKNPETLRERRSAENLNKALENEKDKNTIAKLQRSPHWKKIFSQLNLFGGIEFHRSKPISRLYPGYYAVLGTYAIDSVRCVFLTRSNAYAMLNNCRIIIWNFSDVSRSIRDQNDARLSSSWKFIFQKEELILIVTTRFSVLLNLLSESQKDINFWVMDRDMTIVDFNGSSLLSIMKEPKKKSYIHVIEIPQKENEFLFSRNSHIIFELDSSSFAKNISLACFWEPDCVALVYDYKKIRIYNYKKKALERECEGHKADIIAINGDQSDTLISLSRDRALKVWNRFEKKCIKTYSVKPANFTLGWKYRIQRYKLLIAFSSDQQGVYLMKI
ncbi:hypothetical protein IE077_002560, partial [Cardiosporidium cionae]